MRVVRLLGRPHVCFSLRAFALETAEVVIGLILLQGNSWVVAVSGVRDIVMCESLGGMWSVAIGVMQTASPATFIVRLAPLKFYCVAFEAHLIDMGLEVSAVIVVQKY